MDDASGEALAEEALSQWNADALLCVNNYVAAGALRYCRRSGKRVPEDVAIATFDDYPLAAFLTPPLTAIGIDTFEIGHTAAELLLSLIESGEREASPRLLAPQLIVRESTQKTSR